MARYTEKLYRRHMWILMTAYVALMLLVWPHARGMANLPLKVVLALAPTVPVIALICLIAKRVMASDELQQRLHMMALGFATGVIATASLAGGFLAAAGVIRLDGDVLIWMFPALSLIYGVSHIVLGRRYGGSGCG